MRKVKKEEKKEGRRVGERGRIEWIIDKEGGEGRRTELTLE